MTEDRIRIVVVDDSALFRHLIRDVLNEIPGCSIVGNAEDGKKALQQIADRDPELITLDVEMPGMNGIDVLREMTRRGDRARAIMVSRLTATGAQVTTDALLEGAFDFVLKPSGKNPAANKAELHTALEAKITAYRQSRGQHTVRQLVSVESDADAPHLSRCEVVLIGTSTGGPEALRQILPKLPADLPVPVLVVQHMPPQYTSTLARRLNDTCALNVAEAADDTIVRPGSVLIAPGGRHMRVARRNGQVVTQLTDDPPEHGCRPAVDYLFRSAVETWQGRVVGVILTGMGRDGTEGCRALRERGGCVIAQHPSGCVVFGMPKSVIEQGLSHRIVPLTKIPETVIRETCRAER